MLKQAGVKGPQLHPAISIRVVGKKLILKKFIFLVFILFTYTNNALAKTPFFTYEKLKDRFSFAQMYLSADYLYPISEINYAYQNSVDSTIISGKASANGIPRITIGASHFWGYADFYVKFPLTVSESETAKGSIKFDPGVETGARLYAWPKRRGVPIPFAGISWNYIGYEQNFGTQGPLYEKSLFPVQFGLSYIFANAIIDLGYQWWPSNSFDYPLSRSSEGQIGIPDSYAWLGVRYILDTSIGARGSQLTKTNKSFYIGLGFSSSFSIGDESPYLLSERPFLKGNTAASFFEYTLGYEIYDWRSIISLAYRPMKYNQEAYGLTQNVQRDAWAIEYVRLLYDYHGFVPFVGLSANYDKITYSENDSNISSNTFSKQSDDIRFGLIFGWDIRPLPRSRFILRTSLRYYPNVNFPVESNKTHSLNQLEFNFIQLVYYFGYGVKSNFSNTH